MHAQKIYSRSPCPNARHPPTQTKSSYRTPHLVKDHVETQRRRFKDQIKSTPSVGGTEASEWTNWRRTARENRKKNVHRKKHQGTNRRYGVIPPPKKKAPELSISWTRLPGLCKFLFRSNIVLISHRRCRWAHQYSATRSADDDI